MKRVWNYIVTMWQPAGALILGSIVIAVLFSYRVGSLVPGASQTEIATRNSSQSIKVISDNPINAPYKTVQLVARHVYKSIAVERLINGLAAGFTVILFYLIVRKFCSQYAASVATLLYATSSALLLTARLATPLVTLLFLFVLFVCGHRLRFNKHRTRSWLYSATILGLALYTPGLIYFIILGALWQYRAVRRENQKPALLLLCLSGLIVIILLLPLILGFIQTPNLWHEYFGIPNEIPRLIPLIKSVLAVPAGIMLFAPENSVFRLGRQPLLDAFSAVLFIVGCFSLVKKYRLDRLILIAGIFIIGILFTAISGNYENSILLLPFIFLITGIGVNWLIDEWNKVFPNNPLARALALVIIGLAVMVTVNFQTRRYFVAWPHSSDTKAVFNLKS